MSSSRWPYFFGRSTVVSAAKMLSRVYQLTFPVRNADACEEPIDSASQRTNPNVTPEVQVLSCLMNGKFANW